MEPGNDLEDEIQARDFVARVTIAYTTLAMAGFYPGEPIEPKRLAILEAIDALERAPAAQALAATWMTELIPS